MTKYNCYLSLKVRFTRRRPAQQPKCRWHHATPELLLFNLHSPPPPPMAMSATLHWLVGQSYVQVENRWHLTRILSLWRSTHHQKLLPDPRKKRSNQLTRQGGLQCVWIANQLRDLSGWLRVSPAIGSPGRKFDWLIGFYVFCLLLRRTKKSNLRISEFFLYFHLKVVDFLKNPENLSTCRILVKRLIPINSFGFRA